MGGVTRPSKTLTNPNSNSNSNILLTNKKLLQCKSVNNLKLYKYIFRRHIY